MHNLKLGKLPARPQSISLKLGSYLTPKLKKPPVRAGHLDFMTEPWGILGNDQYGDCVWAGAAHETELWHAEGKALPIHFTSECVLSDYAKVTGFDPKDPATDGGTDMQVAASYRKKTGVIDASGKRHTIAAYLAVKNSKEIQQAVYLFGAMGIGIQFPDSAMDQFRKGQDWTVRKGATIQGGHYIPAIAYDPEWVYVVSWGKVVRASWSFIRKYMDEGVVYLSEEILSGGMSPEGFKLADLTTDLNALK